MTEEQNDIFPHKADNEERNATMKKKEDELVGFVKRKQNHHTVNAPFNFWRKKRIMLLGEWSIIEQEKGTK